MNLTTKYHKAIDDHVRHTRGSKTVCVSTCLNYLGIPLDSYHYTSSNKNRDAWKNVLRKHGYSIRSRMSEIRTSKARTTMTELKRRLKASPYTSSDRFVVEGIQAKKAHLMILDGNGEPIIDTAVGRRWKINGISLINGYNKKRAN